MKLLVLSDLHLEFGRLSTVIDGRGIEEGADVVVLAGDIAEGERGIRWARETSISNEIIYVAGNHEFYSHGFEALIDRMREVARQMDVHFLERDEVTISGVRFLGTTLWTNFELYGSQAVAMHFGGKRMNDFQYIKTFRGFARQADGGIALRNFKPEDARHEHDLSVARLNAELANGDPARTVVVTHHAPSRQSLHPRFDGDDLSPCYISGCRICSAAQPCGSMGTSTTVLTTRWRALAWWRTLVDTSPARSGARLRTQHLTPRCWCWSDVASHAKDWWVSKDARQPTKGDTS